MSVPIRDEARNIHVPCVIFDGRSEDFATEMFVIINSTPSPHHKSHLVDLYERVSWAEPDRGLPRASWRCLYSEATALCVIDQIVWAGRSKQEKWILQAELFNEIHRWVRQAWAKIEKEDGADKREPALLRYGRDFSQACAQVWGDAWGQRTATWSPSRSPSKPWSASAPISPQRMAIRKTAASNAGRTAVSLDRPGP